MAARWTGGPRFRQRHEFGSSRLGAVNWSPLLGVDGDKNPPLMQIETFSRILACPLLGEGGLFGYGCAWVAGCGSPEALVFSRHAEQ